MKTLEECRKAWEKGTKNSPVSVQLELPYRAPNSDYVILYVMLVRGFDNFEYRLHRYFQISGNWEISVDIDWTDEPGPIFNWLNQAFKGLMPKEIR